MSLNTKLKEAFEIESKYTSFYTGGNVELLDDSTLLCQTQNSINFLDTDTGNIKRSIGQSESNDVINTFTCNASHIVIAHKSGLLRQHTHDGTLVKTWKSIHKTPITRLALSDVTESILGTGGADGTLRLWNLEVNTCVFSLKGQTGVVNVIEFHPKQQIIYATSDNLKIVSYDFTSGKILNTFSGHLSVVTSLVFCASKMITTSRDKVLIIWDAKTGDVLHTIPIYESVESSVILDDSRLCFVGEFGVLRVWNIKTIREEFKQTQTQNPCHLNKVLLNKQRDTVTTIANDQTINIYEGRKFACTKQFVGSHGEILDIAYVGDNDSHFALATNTPEIKLHRVCDMSCKILAGHTEMVLCISRVPENANLFVSCGKDRNINLWSVDPPELLCSAVGHSASVNTIAVGNATGGFLVLSAGEDRCIKLWRVACDEKYSFQCVSTQLAHEKQINSVCFSPDGKFAASASQDKQIKLWSVSENLEVRGVLRGHSRGVWCVRFSPTDQVLASTSADCTIRLWSITSLSCLRTLKIHDSAILRLEFTKSGFQVIISTTDGLVKVVNLKSGEVSVDLDAHESQIWGLSFSGDESRLLTAGSDSVIVKWRDVTAERRLEAQETSERDAVHRQQLENLVHQGKNVEALQFSIQLDRPFQSLKIMRNIIKCEGYDSFSCAVDKLNVEQVEKLVKYAVVWNTNSKNSHVAQSLFNVLLRNGANSTIFMNNSGEFLQNALPYTNRHFVRLSKSLEDLNLLNYMINCMNPNAKTVP